MKRPILRLLALPFIAFALNGTGLQAQSEAPPPTYCLQDNLGFVIDVLPSKLAPGIYVLNGGTCLGCPGWTLTGSYTRATQDVTLAFANVAIPCPTVNGYGIVASRSGNTVSGTYDQACDAAGIVFPYMANISRGSCALLRQQGLAEAPQVKAFPQPAHQYVFLSNISAGHQVQMFDVHGRLLANSTGTGSDMLQIETGTWPAGNYFYQVIDPAGQRSAQGHVLVQH